jgi:hypothetical protein
VEEQVAELLTWLLFIYRGPHDPPGRRTYVWRRLKELGAAYLQQAAAILPNDPALRQALITLQARIASYGGEASLLETTSPGTVWERETIARFNQARDAEYAELYESVERLEDEMARESRRGKFTFAELEDLESDWDKLGRWRERIVARDFFAASGRVATDAVMDRARASLNDFTSRVHAQPHTLDDHDLPISSAEPQAATEHVEEKR